MNSWKPISGGFHKGVAVKKILSIVFSRENVLAVLLCLILIALVIFTADTSPTWIYQGF